VVEPLEMEYIEFSQCLAYSLTAFHTRTCSMFLSAFFHLPCLSDLLESHDVFLHATSKHTHLHSFPLSASSSYFSVTCLEACWLSFIISSSPSSSSFFSLSSSSLYPLPIFLPSLSFTPLPSFLSSCISSDILLIW